MTSWVVIAELLKAKTKDGGLSVRATDGLPFLLEEGMEVTFVPPLLRFVRTARVSEVALVGTNNYVVHFEQVSTREQALQLEGHFCLVSRSILPVGFNLAREANLEGFTLVGTAEGHVGTIVAVIEHPGQTLLEVQREQGTVCFVPLVLDWVEQVDEQAHELRVTLPEGLLDL